MTKKISYSAAFIEHALGMVLQRHSLHSKYWYSTEYSLQCQYSLRSKEPDKP